MGKDTDMSKDDLVRENDRLVAEVTRLKVGLEEVQQMFQNLQKTFIESKASFSLARYGELKDMIKKVTSNEVMEKVKSLSENQAHAKRGTTGLLLKAREFAADGGATADSKKDLQSPPSKSGGKFSGFFKKIKNATGFSDDPSDVHYLNKGDIQRDNERKNREIQRMNTRGLRAYNRLEQLQRRYQASKSHAPPTRYQELKDMIKDVISDEKL